MPFMLGIAIVTVAFGLLLMLLKKDGLILSGIILVIGVVLFLIQGIFFGIDTPIMCLIAAISVGLPILTYAIIKLVKKIKAEGTIKKLKDNPALVKRIIIVIVIAAIVITAIVVPASIASKKRRNAFEKAKFFSSERLSEFMVEGLPAPADIDCINLNSETILFYTDTYEFNEYLESVYNYLIGRNFNYLGTRGEVIYAEGEAKTYEFIPHDKGYHYGAYKHSGFSSNETPDDYYFVFSNSVKNEENGEIECCVIHIKGIGISEAVIDGKRFVYDTVMSVYRESISEGYKYPTYNIEYVENAYGDDLADLILPNQPTVSLPGKDIKVRIKPQSKDIDLWIDGGKMIQRTSVTDEYWEYTFTMPGQDVEIYIVPTENPIDPIPPTPDVTYLFYYEEWLNEIDADDVDEVKTTREHLGVAPGATKHIQRTTDKTVIAQILSQYCALTMEALPAYEAETEGASGFTIDFILTDGSIKTISFIGGCYCNGGENYFDLSVIPTLEPYGSESVSDTFSFVTYEDAAAVYDHIGETNIFTSIIEDGIGGLEFINYAGDTAEFKRDEYKYSIETEFGTLYVYNETVFRYLDYCFQLVGDLTFGQLINERDYPFLTLNTWFYLHNSGYNVFILNVSKDGKYRFTVGGDLNNTLKCVLRICSYTDRKTVFETECLYPLDAVFELDEGQYYAVVELIDANDQAIIFTATKE